MFPTPVSKAPISVWLVLFGLSLPLRAMDRWEALSQIESGNNDRAIGKYGEVSRYQIRPRVWQRYASPKADWRAPAVSLHVAQRAMEERCAAFQRRFRRPPSDLEFYVLWNAPAQVGRPTPVVYQRALRFHNLVAGSR